MISYSVVRALMPQHDNSIRSALCTDNDPSLIGRVERIPFQQWFGGFSCAFPLALCALQFAKAKRGFKGEFSLLPTFCGQAFLFSR